MLPRVRIHRPKQCRKVLADQYADTTQGLAMTSSTPGKTTLINHFLINGSWYIVDLPGYGYAQRGKEQQRQIRRIIEEYILNRQQMTCLFVLVDSPPRPTEN